MHLLMVAWGNDAWPCKKAWSKIINSVMYFIVPLTQCPSRMQNIDGGITVFIWFRKKLLQFLRLALSFLNVFLFEPLTLQADWKRKGPLVDLVKISPHRRNIKTQIWWTLLQFYGKHFSFNLVNIYLNIIFHDFFVILYYEAWLSSNITPVSSIFRKRVDIYE